MKAYLANGLFSESDRLYNEYLANRIRDEFSEEIFELYVPQENMEINDKEAFASSVMIADGDDKHLFESDVMIAVIDGESIDAGVACEIGAFSTTGKPIFALYTDSRQQGRDNAKKINALVQSATENQFQYRNLYLIGKIKKSGGFIYSDKYQLINGLRVLYKLIYEL